MRSIPPAGRAFPPLDEELALPPGHLTPFVRERVVRLATWMSFVRAGREVAHFTGVQVGGTTVRRLTERAGAADVYGAETPAARAWLARCRRMLLEEEDDGPALVLAALRSLRMDLAAVAEGDQAPLVWTVAAGEGTADGPLTGVRGQEVAQRARGVVQDSLTYLEPRAAQFRYAAFRAADYPLGSGSVESANKLRVEARLKGAGMQWARPHVNPMVALRTVAYGDGWTAAWPPITTQQRQQARAARADRRAARAQVAQAQAQASPPETPTVSARVTTPPASRAPSRRVSAASGDRTHRPHKPAADHPWRRGSLSRPRCA